jgi:hypothetical protein
VKLELLVALVLQAKLAAQEQLARQARALLAQLVQILQSLDLRVQLVKLVQRALVKLELLVRQAQLVLDRPVRLVQLEQQAQARQCTSSAIKCRQQAAKNSIYIRMM